MLHNGFLWRYLDNHTKISLWFVFPLETINWHNPQFGQILHENKVIFWSSSVFDLNLNCHI